MEDIKQNLIELMADFFLAECICPLLPNPCYKLAAVIYRKTQIEALNKKN